MARLPQVGGDEGSWGDVLNDYLSQAHTDSGALKNDTVGAGQLKPGAVMAPAIGDGQVTSSKIADGAIGTSQLADDAVTGAKLQGAGEPNGIATLDEDGKLPEGQVTTRLEQGQLAAAFGEYVSLLSEGAIADGTTNDWAAFISARTKAGSKGVVYFPAKRGASATTYYLAGSRPDMSGTQIRVDPNVIIKMDASPNLKTFGFITPVTIQNTVHGTTIRKTAAVDLPLAVAAAASARNDSRDLSAIDLTTLTPMAFTGTDPMSPVTRPARSHQTSCLGRPRSLLASRA